MNALFSSTGDWSEPTRFCDGSCGQMDAICTAFNEFRNCSRVGAIAKVVPIAHVMQPTREGTTNTGLYITRVDDATPCRQARQTKEAYVG